MLNIPSDMGHTLGQRVEWKELGRVVNRSGRELETSLHIVVRDICHPDVLSR